METLRIGIISETLPRERLNLQPWRYLGDLAQALRREGHEAVAVTRRAEMKDWNGVPLETEADASAFRSGRGLRTLVESKHLDGGLFRLTASLFFSMRRRMPPDAGPGRLAGIFLRPIHSGRSLAARFLDPDLVPEMLMDRHHAALYVSRLVGTWPSSRSVVDRYLFLWDSDKRSAVAAGLPETRCSVIRHPFDPAFVSDAPATLSPALSAHLSPVPRRLVFSGPPEATRGPDDAVRALRWLPADPPVQLVLLLRDPRVKQVTVTRGRKGPHEVVEVRGLVTREDIRAVYQSSQVAVFPYRFVRTALPLVPLEAAAAGLPVVTTRVHPLRELEGWTPLIFAKPRDARSIAASISSVLEDDRRAEITRRNREWVRGTPEWPEVARAVAAVLRA